MKHSNKHSLLITILVCLIIFLLCIIIFDESVKNLESISTLRENAFTFFTAIACSIISSCIVMLLPLPNNTSKDIDKIVKETIRNLPDDRFPIKYEDTNEPISDFNNRLNQGIMSTKKYIYFGDRALYLTKRLGKEIIHHDARLSINVFLADIREDSIFRSRKDMYLQKERANHHGEKCLKSIKEIINNEKMEILRSLYALGKLSDRYEIHVYLHKEIPFIRFELTDSLTVLTFLTQWTSGKKYPATLLFENQELFHTNFMDYSEQLKNRSKELHVDDLTIDSLRKLAKSAGLPEFEDSELTDYYEKNVK